MVSWIDSFTQYLTTASLWIQIPVVLIMLLPLAAVLALVWLRVIDQLSVVFFKLSARFRPSTADTLEAADPKQSTKNYSS